MARLALKAEARRFYLSYFWWVLEPLLYVMVFWLVFDKLLGTPTPDFLMFLAVGKLTFTWFSKTVSTAAGSLVNNVGLIGRMDMPKTLFPMAAILECSYKQIAVFILLGLFVILDGRPISVQWGWLLPLAVVQLLLIITCGFMAALLVCLSQDFAPLINLGMIFLMFMSGVFWDPNELANIQSMDLLMLVNPVAFLLNGYRQVLLWQVQPDLHHLMGLGLVLSLTIALLAVFMQRYSRHIARRILSK